MKKILFLSALTFCFVQASKASTEVNKSCNKHNRSSAKTTLIGIKFSCCTGYYTTDFINSLIQSGTLSSFLMQAQVTACGSDNTSIV